MAEYLIAQGADPADVLPETAARDTRENLVFSAEVQHRARRDGPALAVTNNCHVLRTAVLARQIGSKTQVVGSPTASYYLPSAILREFVALMVEYRRIHLVLVTPFIAVTILAMIAVNVVG